MTTYNIHYGIKFAIVDASCMGQNFRFLLSNGVSFTATHPIRHIPDQVKGLEAEAIKSITKASPLCLDLGAGALPLEATIHITDTNKPLCILQPTHHIMSPKSEQGQYWYFIVQLQHLHNGFSVLLGRPILCYLTERLKFHIHSKL